MLSHYSSVKINGSCKGLAVTGIAEMCELQMCRINLWSFVGMRPANGGKLDVWFPQVPNLEVLSSTFAIEWPYLVNTAAKVPEAVSLSLNNRTGCSRISCCVLVVEVTCS